MALVAGIDSSTQSCKVVIRDLDTGEIVREGRAPHPPGTAVDPVLWWEALLAAVKDAGGLEDVAALSVGGQQHGMVALDDQGNALRDAPMWNDTSSYKQVETLNDELGREEWIKRTGLSLAPSFTVTKVRWLKDNEPENAEKTAAIVLPHDYLTWRLKGGEPGSLNFDDLTTDRSDASGTGYWSGSTEDYCEDLFELALGLKAHLPRVLGPTDKAGLTGSGLPGIPAGLPIGVGGGDNAVAALALGLNVGDAVMSLGTSGTVYAKTDSPVQDMSGNMASFADADGAHLPLGATLNAARDIDIIADLLGIDFDEVARLAIEATPGAEGMTLLPYFEGERTPNLPNARAWMSGMSLGNTTRDNLARAAFEGMLASQVVMLDALKDLGVPVERVLIIGGAAKSPAVQAILPQIIEEPIFAPDAGEYVANGAAAQAAAALTGEFPNWEVAGEEVEAAEHHPEIMEQHLEIRKVAYGV